MKNLTYSLLFGLIFALTSFFLTSNLYITIAVFLAFTIAFYLFVIRRVIQLNIDNSKKNTVSTLFKPSSSALLSKIAGKRLLKAR